MELAMFLTSLKPLVEGLAKECPQELLVQIFDFLNNTFTGMKESLLTHFAKNHKDENKEKLWNKVITIYADILHPLGEAKKLSKSNAIQEDAQKLNFAIKQYQMNKGSIENASDYPYWPNPLDIDFIRQKVADDVVTISCKIGPLKIPYALIDTGSNCCVISDNIAKRLGLEVDKSVYKIKGYATYAHSIGIVTDIPITIENNNVSITQSDEFLVVKAEKDKHGRDRSLLVLGTPWQDKVKWEPITKREFKVFHQGEWVSFPLSVHKANRNMNSFHLEKSSFGLKKS